MARHRDWEGEEDLKLRIVFNMQSRIVNEGGPSARDPGEMLTAQNKEICSFGMMIWKFALCGYDSISQVLAKRLKLRKPCPHTHGVST